MSSFTTRVSHIEGKVQITVLHVSGEIDETNAPQFDEIAQDILNDNVNHILLDLTKSKTISIAGVHSMEKIYQSLKALPDDTACIKILKPSKDIQCLIHSMNLDTRLPIYYDFTDAVDAF